MAKQTYLRADLEKIIEAGGAVLHRGVLILSKDQLPTEADLKAAHEGQDRIEVDAPTVEPLPDRNVDEDGNDPLIGTEAGIARDKAIEAQATITPSTKENKPASGDPKGSTAP